jgi:antimicrobial peptide system SdpA family protein
MRKLHRWMLLLTDAGFAAFWLAVGCLYFVAANTHSPVSMSQRDAHSLLSIGPEGWGFFTRDPQEKRLLLYSVSRSTGKLVEASPATVRTWYQVMAGSRASRIRGMEIAKLQTLIEAESWQPCRRDAAQCLNAQPVRVVNPMHVKTVCGEHVLQVQAPTPWAWAGSASKIHMPSRVVRIDVDCGSKQS